jgi:hypothetical protein
MSKVQQKPKAGISCPAFDSLFPLFFRIFSEKVLLRISTRPVTSLAHSFFVQIQLFVRQDGR